ncbi:MAG: hypothetical protein KBD31_03930 [Proteobacteria bacterium]|nr:hypothetical protein [Pseudomonadota bacterium]
MDFNHIVNELAELYETLKQDSDFKYAAQVLMYIAKLKGCFNKQKDFDLKSITDEELTNMIQRLESKNNA